MQDFATKYGELIQLDKRLVDVSRNIKILSSLTWPAELAEEFMKSWEKKNPKLPKIEHSKFEYDLQKEELGRIIKAAKNPDPLYEYVNQTAKSYLIAAIMLENVGTKVFQEMSEILYGTSTDKLGSDKVTNLSAAENFVTVTSDFADQAESLTDAPTFTPTHVAKELKKVCENFFPNDPIDVVIDPHLASKAAAGGKRVRLRGLASFTQADIDQLIQHELFVHSATMLNGYHQPHLKSLGLGSPRTTCTQEGIATFAELITATMDLSRLRRIALRIKAIHLTYDGADFLDIFKFFLKSGQSVSESFQSAARVFRGGNVKGGVAFTKDVVYLKGLISVHTFLRKAAQMRKIDFPKFLFIGRIALGDIISLEPYIASGFIANPLYQPPWVANREGLVAYLSYAVFANQLKLGDISLNDFIEKLPANVHLETPDLSAV